MLYIILILIILLTYVISKVCVWALRGNMTENDYLKAQKISMMSMIVFTVIAIFYIVLGKTDGSNQIPIRENLPVGEPIGGVDDDSPKSLLF